MKVILLRHGQTYWNKQMKLQGRTDIPLNDTGRAQARAASAKLPPVELCLVSPLCRAWETARLALEGQDAEIRPELLLAEQGYGVCEARNERICSRVPWDVMYPYYHHPERWQPPIGAESFEDLSARAARFVQECLVPL